MEPWSATHQSSHSTSDILPTALTAAPNAANASTAFQYAAAAPSDVLNLSLEDAWFDSQQLCCDVFVAVHFGGLCMTSGL